MRYRCVTLLRLLRTIPLIAVAIGCSAYTVRDVEARYGPVRPHWIGTPAHIAGVLYLGLIHDPATMGGRIIPTDAGNGGIGDQRWFTAVGLDRLDVFLRPDQAPNAIVLGPGPTEPTGIYAFERHLRSEANCAPYDRVMNRMANIRRISGDPFEPPLPSGECLTYRYIGPLELNDAPYIFLQYFDQEALKAGFGVLVTEIRRGQAEVVARSVACFQNYAVKQLPNCNGSDRLLDIYN